VAPFQFWSGVISRGTVCWTSLSLFSALRYNASMTLRPDDESDSMLSEELPRTQRAGVALEKRVLMLESRVLQLEKALAAIAIQRRKK
jgi:hypothetical protein